MKKITLLLLLVAFAGFSQEKYIFNASLPDITVADMLKHADSIFTPSSQFAFNCNTNYLVPYNKIFIDSGSKPGYLEEQLKLIEKDSLQPTVYGNLGLYYENKGEGEKAVQYYKKALDKVGYIKFDKDSARMYSYKSYLKYHLGQDGAADMEKGILINKNDSLAVYFYPMYLLTAQKYNEAEKVLVSALENKDRRYYGYLMLYMAKVFEGMGRLSESGEDMAKAFANIDAQKFVDMGPYQKYFKKNDEDFELMREMSELLVVTLKAMSTMDNKDLMPGATEMAILNKKEAFFKSRLKKKDANLFGLYMSLGTCSIAKREFAAGISNFEKAAAVFPKDKECLTFNRLETYYNIVTIYTYLKDYDKAITVLKTALEVPVITDVKKAGVLVDIAKQYYLKNDIDTATEYAKQSVELIETFDGDMFLGYMYVRQDLHTLGQRYIEKAQQLSSTVDNLSHLVNYYMIVQMVNGNFDEVVNMYEGNKEPLSGNCKSCEYLIKHYLVAK